MATGTGEKLVLRIIFFIWQLWDSNSCRLIYRINVAHRVLKRKNAVWHHHRCETGFEFR